MPRTWLQKTSLSFLLWPLSCLFRGVTGVRRMLYQKGLRRSYRAPVPVVVIGNITVGGTGKTPFLMALVEVLQAAGYRPGVISRGYGGDYQSKTVFLSNTTKPQEVGDEPVLIFKRTGVPVVVGRKRVQAIQHLLSATDCDVVLSDDGLQHLSLQRDLEIVLLDAARGLGNGFLLPAGPLREPVARLKTVDWVLSQDKVVTEKTFTLYTTGIHRVNAPEVQAAFSDFQHQAVHAVAGIGNPQRFFQTLSEKGLFLKEHPFPDHYAFAPKDLAFDLKTPVLMTEKDAVKCAGWAPNHYWFVRVDARLPEGFVDGFLKKLQALSKVNSA